VTFLSQAATCYGAGTTSLITQRYRVDVILLSVNF